MTGRRRRPQLIDLLPWLMAAIPAASLAFVLVHFWPSDW